MSTDGLAPFFAEGEVIRLTRDGKWMSDDTEIDHEQTIRLFSRSLHHDEKGYYIRVGREAMRIIVEDTPYFVKSVEWIPALGLKLTLNDETQEMLKPDTLRYTEGRLVCRVKSNAFEARFMRQPYYEVLNRVETDPNGYFLRIDSKHIRLL